MKTIILLLLASALPLAKVGSCPSGYASEASCARDLRSSGHRSRSAKCLLFDPKRTIGRPRPLQCASLNRYDALS